MAGNFSEWCWDWYPVPAIPYQAGSPYLGGTDPTGPSSGSGRVMRGGNWVDPASSVRCAVRAAAGDTSPQAGFRCVIRVN
jgi:sulfatase modifying factor 1